MTAMKIKSVSRAAIAAAVLCMALFGAAGAFAQRAPEPSDSAYVKENLASFSSFTLSNGIPVYVKRVSESRIANVSLVLRGGSLAAAPAQAGWENLAFRTMVRGSAEWPYESLAALLDEKSASIGSDTQFEYSVCSLNSIDTYFDELLPVWASLLMRPTFTQDDFDQVRSEAEMALQEKEQDPWARAAQIMNREFFADHPYGIVPEGTQEGIAAATPQALAEWRTAHFSADRMMIVAVGNFGAEALRAPLEREFGSIPRMGSGRATRAPEFSGASAGKLLTEAFPQSRNVAYLRGDFPAPSPDAASFMPANVAMKMFSDLLFAIVRDKYGATYTPGAYIRAFGANYGSVTIYKTSATAAIKSYIDEAIALFAGGKCVSVDPTRAGDEAKFMAIPDALAAYKAMYANSHFESVRTSASVAGLIIQSAVTRGDPMAWVDDAARIGAVRADEVAQAFKDAILSGRISWVAVGDGALLDKMDPRDFAATPSVR